MLKNSNNLDQFSGYPKVVKSKAIISDNPLKKRIKFLQSEILRHQDLYYNKTPEISDSEFDILVNELHKLAPDNPILHLVGRDSSKLYDKVKHIIPMNSQGKANHVDEFLKWTKKYNYPQYLVQHKLDGISVELQYVNGRLKCAVSRGDGVIGDDITQNVKRMNEVPKKVDKGFSGAVRGEIVMFRDIFSRKYSDQKNCRNTASGITKRKDGEGCQDLNVICYNAKNIITSFQDELTKIEWLKENGFSVVTIKIVKDPKEIVLYRKDLHENLRNSLEYDIDGLVIKGMQIDWEDMKRNHPEKQIAFKFPLEEAISILKDVEWSQQGSTFTPVAIIEPIELAGTTVRRASLANPDLIKNLNLMIGSEVIVVKRGEIIPKIIKVVYNSDECEKIFIPEICPICKELLVNDSTRLYCPNVSCTAKDLHRLKKWINVLDIKNFGDKLLGKLFETNKIRRISDLYKLKISDISTLERQGIKSAEKALNNLFAIKSLSLAKFIGGFDIEGIGETIIDLVVNAGYDSIKAIKNASTSDLANIEGMGDINAEKIINGIVKLEQDMIDLLETKKINIESQTKNGLLSGKSFCITGKLNIISRNEAKELIISLGGQFKSGVTKTLTYLVTNDPSSGSSKNTKARDLGIKIITESEFLDLTN
jgi:DNA ligase (NAD+)